MDAISPWKDTKTENKDIIDESLYRGESHASIGSQEITIPIDTPEDPNYNATDKKSSQQSNVQVQNQILEHAVEQEDKSVCSEKSDHHLVDPVDVQNQTDNDADSEGMNCVHVQQDSVCGTKREITLIHLMGSDIMEFHFIFILFFRRRG